MEGYRGYREEGMINFFWLTEFSLDILSYFLDPQEEMFKRQLDIRGWNSEERLDGRCTHLRIISGRGWRTGEREQTVQKRPGEHPEGKIPSLFRVETTDPSDTLYPERRA